MPLRILRVWSGSSLERSIYPRPAAPAQLGLVNRLHRNSRADAVEHRAEAEERAPEKDLHGMRSGVSLRHGAGADFERGAEMVVVSKVEALGQERLDDPSVRLFDQR